MKSFDELLSQLESEGIPHSVGDDADDQRVTIPTLLGAEQSVLHLRWNDESGLLQFIQPLPLDVPETTSTETRSAFSLRLHQINQTLLVPGFVLNSETGQVAYRTQHFLGQTGEVEPGLVGALISMCAKTAGNALEPLRNLLDADR